MRVFLLRAGWVLVVAVAAAFFLPWVKLQTAAFNRVVERQNLVGALASEGDGPWYARYFGLDAYDRKAALDEPFHGESGFELVRLAHDPAPLKRQKARQTAEAFGLKDATLGAIAVYAAPALALLGIAFLVLGLRLPVLILGLLALGSYFGARYGLDATFVDRTVNGVNVGAGLWITLYALLGLGVLLVVSCAAPAGHK